MAWMQALESSPKKQWDDISQNMLKVLQREGKLLWVKRIEHEIGNLMDARDGVVAATVTSAYPVDQKKVKQIVEELLGGEKVRLTFFEDPELLGGMVVETENNRWDATMKNELHQLTQSLMVDNDQLSKR